MFNMRLGKDTLTHEELLHVLPFECGYTCNEDGAPNWESVITAISLISIDAIVNPHNIYTPQIN